MPGASWKIFCRRAIAWAGLTSSLVFAAQAEPPTTRDTLVYKDGDRVQGKLVTRTEKEIVFKADRFGELHVPTADAVVILAEKPPEAAPTAPAVSATNLPAVSPSNPPAASASNPPAVSASNPPPAIAPASPAKAAAEHAEEERMTIWDRFSPAVLTAKVRNFFGPWHGRLALSTEVVSDTADRSDIAFDGHLQRKWKADDVQLNTRYDYAETNHLTTTDTWRGSGSWHHDFSKKVFAVYRPSVEWNRAAVRSGVHNEYVLLQQEIGAGFSLLARPGRKLRAGVSENLFDVWNSAPTPDHNSRAKESLFEEVEWTLPWRMTLTQRGVWYPLPGRADAWENSVELNKKLTETLSAALRHEIRRNNPDGTAQDYTRLKLLVGFDF